MRLKEYLNENLEEGKAQKGVNKAGTQYAIVQSKKNPEQYIVWKQSKNYKLGHIRTSWVFVTPKKMDSQTGQKYATEGIPYDDALALFNKRLKGKTK